jgi:hypothetical protein
MASCLWGRDAAITFQRGGRAVRTHAGGHEPIAACLSSASIGTPLLSYALFSTMPRSRKVWTNRCAQTRFGTDAPPQGGPTNIAVYAPGPRLYPLRAREEKRSAARHYDLFHVLAS